MHTHYAHTFSVTIYFYWRGCHNNDLTRTMQMHADVCTEYIVVDDRLASDVTVQLLDGLIYSIMLQLESYLRHLNSHCTVF